MVFLFKKLDFSVIVIVESFLFLEIDEIEDFLESV